MTRQTLSDAPAFMVSSQDTKTTGAFFCVRKSTLKRLARDFPSVPAGIINAKCFAAYRIIRAAIHGVPINKEVETIVRVSLERGMSSRALATTFVEVLFTQRVIE